MIKIQKRFILSALVSGIAFILFYIVFDFYLLVSLLLSIVIYVGGVFLFRGKDMRLYDVQAISKYYFEMSKLNDYKEKIKDKNIRNKLTKIVNVSSKITKYLETKPNNATKIYNFLDYYLPFTTKIVTKYIEAESKDEKTFVENKLILKMSVYIKEVEHECDRLLEEIVKSKDKELDFEMKIFEKTSDIDFDDEGSEENDEK
mgnify:FL=1